MTAAALVRALANALFSDSWPQKPAGRAEEGQAASILPCRVIRQEWPSTGVLETAR